MFSIPYNLESSIEYVEEFDENFAPLPPYTNRGGITHTSSHTSPLGLTPSTFSCIVDYLSLTFSIVDVHTHRKVKNPDNTIQTIEDEAQAFLLKLVDYIPHLNWQDRDKGLFGYKQSIGLYRDEQAGGLLAFDGNNGTCLLSLTGKGCSGVNMVELRRFLEKLPSVKITRVDLAHDDLDGALNVDYFLAQYKAGNFHVKGTAPGSRYIDDLGNNTGCTLYVGNKDNGKEACIYEKGKQMRDKDSKWLRVEGRLTSVDRIIPFDTLTSPEMYLAGLYPPFRYLCVFHERIEVIKKHAKLAMEQMIGYASVAYGKLVNVMVEIGNTPDEIIKALRVDGCPKRLQIPFAPEPSASCPA